MNSLTQNNIRKLPGYWTEGTILDELRVVIRDLGHFPSHTEMVSAGKNGLSLAISRQGKIDKFRKLLGYKSSHKHNGYWSDESITNDLTSIIEELGYFPSYPDLVEMNKTDLKSIINNSGGLNKFRELLGYKPIRKHGYWTEEITTNELKLVINKLGHFPNGNELEKMSRNDLKVAISKHGGFNKFRKMLGYELIRKRGYWTEETIIHEVRLIIEEIGHFPSYSELLNKERDDLAGAIDNHGGMSYFWKIFGIDPTQKQKIQSKISSYIGKRGANSEKIVKELITKWCYAHNLPQPDFNVKLVKGNVIEFVCETDKRIGIDVTNTKASRNTAYSTIKRKWNRKQYHLHLDELWIIVFSDVLTNSDYMKFNSQSPDNVKIMSINTFIEELQISVDDNLQLKINNYSACTFHNKDDFLKPKQGLSKFFKIRPDIRIENRSTKGIKTMTLVKNTKIFDDFASFSIHDILHGKSKIEELGHYDPNSLKRYHDPKYQSGLGHTHSIYEDVYIGGTWTSYNWTERFVIYDDHYLDGKPCVHLFFRHYPFGNGFLSKKLTLGHWHHIYIVSCNDISILDCMRVHESKDIYFTGKLIKDMPIIDASEEHYLYVIECEKI